MTGLTWLQTDYGPVPDCGPCTEMILSPFFTEAVASSAIETTKNPHNLAIEAIEAYHHMGHTMKPVSCPSCKAVWESNEWCPDPWHEGQPAA